MQHDILKQSPTQEVLNGNYNDLFFSKIPS